MDIDDFNDELAPEVIDTVLHALIAQLHANGILQIRDLDAIAKRLDFADMNEAGARIRRLPISDAIISPETMRSHLSVIDGGNETD